MLLNAVLERKNAKTGVRISVKSAVTVAVIALAVALPQIVHIVAGAQGGVQWLPMYAPVLLGGCLLGIRWGLGAGILAPIVSFALTAVVGDPMPAASRLPYMIVELAVFAAVSGAFSGLIVRNAWAAFPAVLLAQVAGRAVFLAIAAIFQGVSALDAATVWSQIQSGMTGMLLQAVVVPAIVIVLRAVLLGEKKTNSDAKA